MTKQLNKYTIMLCLKFKNQFKLKIIEENYKTSKVKDTMS